MTSIYYRTKSKKTGRYTWVKIPNIDYFEEVPKSKVTKKITPKLMIKSNNKGKWKIDFQVDGFIILEKVTE